MEINHKQQGEKWKEGKLTALLLSLLIFPSLFLLHKWGFWIHFGWLSAIKDGIRNLGEFVMRNKIY